MFTEDEFTATILEAINAGAQTGEAFCEPGCTTTGLLMNRYDCTQYKAEKLLKQLVKAGKLKRAWVEFTDGWGCSKKVKGYRLV
jgi:hypothetical protein